MKTKVEFAGVVVIEVDGRKCICGTTTDVRSMLEAHGVKFRCSCSGVKQPQVATASRTEMQNGSETFI
jgi:hypothetical protein